MNVIVARKNWKLRKFLNNGVCRSISRQKSFNTRTGRVGQVLYLNVSDDLPSKKSSLQKIFGFEFLNLTLRNKKVEEIPSKQWATLCVARKNFSENQRSIIVAAGLGFEPRIFSSKGRCPTVRRPGNAQSFLSMLYCLFLFI